MRTHDRRAAGLIPCFVMDAFLLVGFTAAHAWQAERVVIVVVDGPRDTEFLEHPTHEYTPCIWNDLRPQGYLSHTFYNLGRTVTVSGHASMLTGTHQDLSDEGDERPTRPMIWEYLRDQTGLDETSSLLVTYKDKLAILSFSTCMGYGAEDSATVIGPTWEDAQCVDRFFEFADEHEPVLSVIALGYTDAMGHTGDWDAYTGAIYGADNLAASVWDWIQSHPSYADRTAFFITADHGRHTWDFQGHGDDCPGCRHLPLVAIGPDFRVNLEDWSTDGDMRDICCTAAEILGIDTPYADGRILWEIFTDPADAPIPPSTIWKPHLLLAASPAFERTEVRLAEASEIAPASRWLARLLDASGRRLWQGQVSGQQLQEGWTLSRPAGWTGSGATWLELRQLGTSRGVRLQRTVIWVR